MGSEINGQEKNITKEHEKENRDRKINMDNKKLQVAVVAALAVIVLGMMWLLNENDKKAQASMEAALEETREYDQKITEIKASINEKMDEMKALNESERAATVILTFSEEDVQLEGEILPRLTELGIPGTVVLNPAGAHRPELLGALHAQGWDMALGGAIGEDQEAYAEQLRTLASSYEANRGMPMRAYFFNGKEYAKGSEFLYSMFAAMSVRMSAAFPQNPKILNHRYHEISAERIEECHNISMREDMKLIQSLVNQAIEEKSIIVLSDFGVENQMEIQNEGPLEQLDEVLTYLTERQGEGVLRIQTAGQYLDTVAEQELRQTERKNEYQEYKRTCEEEIEKLRLEKVRQRAK